MIYGKQQPGQGSMRVSPKISTGSGPSIPNGSVMTAKSIPQVKIGLAGATKVTRFEKQAVANRKPSYQVPNSARSPRPQNENLEYSASAASVKRKILPVRNSRNLNSREKYFTQNS